MTSKISSELGEQTEKQFQQGKKIVKKSFKDWWCYIQEHPLQSLMFGMTIYLAAKGLLHED